MGGLRARSVRVAAAALVGAMALGAGLAFGPATPASADVNQVYSTDEDGAGALDHYLSHRTASTPVAPSLASAVAPSVPPSRTSVDAPTGSACRVTGPDQRAGARVPPRGLEPGEYEMIGFNQANDAITARAGFTLRVVRPRRAVRFEMPAPTRRSSIAGLRETGVQGGRRSQATVQAGRCTRLIGGMRCSSARSEVRSCRSAIAQAGFRIFTMLTGLHALEANCTPSSSSPTIHRIRTSTRCSSPSSRTEPTATGSDRPGVLRRPRPAGGLRRGRAARLRAIPRSRARRGRRRSNAQIRRRPSTRRCSPRAWPRRGRRLRAIAERARPAGGRTRVVDAAYLARSGPTSSRLQQRVPSTGFTESEVAEMTAAGVEPDEIDAVRDEVGAYDLSTGHAGRHDGREAAPLGDTTSTTRSSRSTSSPPRLPRLAELPNGEEPPSTRRRPPSFTATPSSGEAPLDVVFDATGSTDAEAPIAVLRLGLR